LKKAIKSEKIYPEYKRRNIFMEHTIAVVLAAGEGKRMHSNKHKVIHKICGKSIIDWIYGAIKGADVEECVFVVGHKADQVKAHMGDKVEYVLQEQQLGTGHAVMQAEKYLRDKDGYALVLCGDTPLITAETIKKTLEYHKSNNYSATVITADIEKSDGYGRILRDANGDVIRIVEHRDASEEERRIKEINSGLFCFTLRDLVAALGELNNNNDQGEYYITDTLEILRGKGKRIGAMKLQDSTEIFGVNDRVQLFQASEVIRKEYRRS
jgi:bifunctional UDP-N-acetylglucosamine pyrophosphorylase/glucosamine-1-phosphate N-acetyltransferase